MNDEYNYHECWLAYKRWMMALLRRNVKSEDCYSINYYAIQKHREEREQEEE